MAIASSFEHPLDTSVAYLTQGHADYLAGYGYHLGEDWSAGPGDEDIGFRVDAAGNGRVVTAANLGGGWGNVIIIQHTLSDGSIISTIYGHLDTILVSVGDDVGIGEQIGTIGDAFGVYDAHLHFAVYLGAVDVPGGGYSGSADPDPYGSGYIDPTYFFANPDVYLPQGTWGETDGSDDLNGTSGNDHMHAKDGADTVRGHNGADTIFGDAGQDEVYGGDGSDSLLGGVDSDWLYGEADDDSLQGEGGSDTIYGGDGLDSVHGGIGADSIVGEGSEDTLFGDEGQDTLFGGTSDDYVNGGADGDDLRGDFGSDQLVGEGGNDTLYGGDALDTLYGGAGKDLLIGESWYDQLFGGSGKDMLFGGTYNDTLSGGGGADTFHFGINSELDVVSDFEDNVDTLKIDRLLLDGEDISARRLLRQLSEVVADGLLIDVGSISGQPTAILVLGVFSSSVLFDDFGFY